MSQKVSICLLGPKGAGKSSLLGSLADCVGQGAYGYSPNFHPVLQPISQVDFLKGPIDRQRADFLTHALTPYERLKQDLVAGAAATNTLDTYEYYFRLSLSDVAARDLKQAGPWLLEIIDSAGDIAMPRDGAQIALLDDVKTDAGRQRFLDRAIAIIRSQSAAVFGNVAMVVPVAIVVQLAIWMAFGFPSMTSIFHWSISRA